MSPRLLDLFCGAGGAAMGYDRAGFEVTGVDIQPQPDYPFEFYRADAMTFPFEGFDVVHASPPCQLFTRAKHLRKAQGRESRSGDLLTPFLTHRVPQITVPWVVENVDGSPLPSPLTLCGSMFGLKVRRHRGFLCSELLLLDRRCNHSAQGRPIGVYHKLNDKIPHGGHTAETLAEAQEAMGIDWMPWDSLKEAIPPAYTEWIGAQLLAVLPFRVGEGT